MSATLRQWPDAEQPGRVPGPLPRGRARTIFVPVTDARARLLAPLLSEGEAARAGQLRAPGDRARAIVARGAVRVLLGLVPDVELLVEEGGRPYAPAGEWSFSVSHAGGGVAIVLAPRRSGPVGIDLEPVRPLRDLDGLVSVALGDVEAAWLATVPQPWRERAFLRLWTAKEAYLKAVGVGLRMDPRACVPLPVGGAVTTWTAPDGIALRARPVALDASWVATVALPHAAPRATPLRWRDDAVSEHRRLLTTSCSIT